MKVEKNYKSDDYIDTFKPIEVVVVNDRIEEAIGRFRAMVTKERIMSDLKSHSFYEKPSDKKRRRQRESQARQRKLTAMQKSAGSADEFDNLL